MIRLVYNSFLADFHLYYGYWRKACCALLTRVVEVFEQSMQSATYSSDVWFHYCNLASEVPPDGHRKSEYQEEA